MTLTLAPETEARLRAAAARKGLAPEEVIDVLLRHDLNGAADVLADAEQERLQGIFERLHAEALALEVEPASQKADRAPEEVQVSEIIAEKFRKQGFNI